MGAEVVVTPSFVHMTAHYIDKQIICQSRETKTKCRIIVSTVAVIKTARKQGRWSEVEWSGSLETAGNRRRSGEAVPGGTAGIQKWPCRDIIGQSVGNLRLGQT